MCGIVGLCNSQDISLLVKACQNLQHRGQESYGFGYFNNNRPVIYTAQGMVRNFNLRASSIGSAKPLISMGHLRYSTSGNSKKCDFLKELESQPLISPDQQFILCHNGNIPNMEKLRKKILAHADNELIIPVKNSTTDSQLLVYFIYQLVKKEKSWDRALTLLLNEIPGIYNLIITTSTSVYIVRDKYGVRPFQIGKIDDYYLFGSESIIFNNFKPTWTRDVIPGEIITITGDIITTNIRSANRVKPIPCLFELIYFLNPESVTDTQSVLKFRQDSGKILAKKEQLNFKDPSTQYLVVAAPSTGIPTAIIYATTLGLEYRQVLIKDNKIGRTFILENDVARLNACRKKYSLTDYDISGKSIILVDDSLVRGNTLKTINKLFLDNGAKEVHVRIASPPVKYPCYFGIDIPTSEELIYNQTNGDVDLICQRIEAESLVYLTIKDMKSIYHGKYGLYTGCFTGEYNGIKDW